MSRHPMKDIYAYLNAQVVANAAFSPYTGAGDSNIASTVPIYPVQQTSETNENPGPFIVYDVVPLAGDGDSFWIHRDSVIFTVYSANYSQLSEWIMDLRELFGRLDLSAEDINATVAAQSITTPNKFLCVYVVDSPPGAPAPDEMGRMSQIFTIEYEYTRAVTNDGKFAS